MQKKTTKPVEKSKSIQPLGDRVLIRPYTEGEVKGEKKADYGIIIPDSVKEERSAQGMVLAVGEGKYVDGKLIPMQVKVGDVVIFSRYSYDEVEFGGQDLYLLKEENIFAVIK
jgi:chaperonin GroES